MDQKFASFKWPLAWHNFFLIAMASTDQKFQKKDQRLDFQALIPATLTLQS